MSSFLLLLLLVLPGFMTTAVAVSGLTLLTPHATTVPMSKERVVTPGDPWAIALDAANAHAAKGEYHEAILIWEALIAERPEHPTPYGNLGRLYFLTLHDYEKAEYYLLEELRAAPQDRHVYRDLYELYRSAYKQETNAVFNLLSSAHAAFPKDTDFLVLTAETYVYKGDAVRGRRYYEEALSIARAAGDIDRMRAIGNALALLP